MHNLGILFKNNINLLIGKIRGKKANKSTKSAVTILVIGVLSLLMVYSFQTYTMIDGFHEFGVEKMALFHCCLTSLSVFLILGMMRTTAIEKSRDADMLLSLPIKKIDIILSKTFGYYLFDLAFSLILFAPYFVLYQFISGFNLTILIGGIILTFLFPLLSVGISFILTFVFSRILNRLKSANLIKSIVLILFLTLIVVLMIFKQMTYNPQGITDLESFFADRVFANLLLKFMCGPNITNTLFALGITIVPFVLGLILYTINYGKSFIKYMSKNKNLKFDNNKGALGLLIKKEASFYATTPGYIINTIIGPILALTLSIYLSYVGINEVNGIFGGILSTSNVPFIIGLLFCGLFSITQISASSISLEGKNFWILKSSPIKENNLFLSKVLNHLIMTLPFAVLSSTIISISASFSFVQFLYILSPCLLVSLVLAVGGVFINLWLPNLNWDDPTKVVKNSLSSLFSMVLGLVLTIIPIALLLIFDTLTLTYVFLISISIYFVLFIIFTILLFAVGKKLFNKI